MPVFYILVVIGTVVLWFLMSWAYKPVGKFVKKIIKDAINILNK